MEQVRRGPKPNQQEEKKVAVVFWVKQKHYLSAKKRSQCH